MKNRVTNDGVYFEELSKEQLGIKNWQSKTQIFPNNNPEKFIPFGEFCIIEFPNRNYNPKVKWKEADGNPTIKCYGHFEKIDNNSSNFAGFKVFSHDHHRTFTTTMITYLPEIIVHYDGQIGLDFFMKELHFTEHEKERSNNE